VHPLTAGAKDDADREMLIGKCRGTYQARGRLHTIPRILVPVVWPVARPGRFRASHLRRWGCHSRHRLDSWKRG